MNLNIGDGNLLQGNINIGNHAKQEISNVNNNFSVLLNSLESDMNRYYNKIDKAEVLDLLSKFRHELESNNKDKSTLIDIVGKLKEPFNFIASSSSIAGFIIALVDIFHK